LSLFNELKRRNVFKVGIAYTVIAWLIAQVADLVFDNIAAPEWLMPALLFLLAVGLVLALIFAWAFEMTPDGIKKEKDIDRSQFITLKTGRKLDFIIIGALVMALGYFAYDKFVLDPSRDAELVQARTEAVTEQAIESGKEETTDKSIAVLAFVNMSDDASNEFFSDGISEELINLLTKIPELRVTSRSSAFSYKGKDFKISDVGRELNVANVLEGSVRKFGNQLRITAQLIKTSSDTHLWSETYDRTMDNIFIIQDEIAAAVVDQLKLTLLGSAPRSEQTDPEAYALYLQGRHLNREGSTEQKEQAQALLEQALEIDQNYVAAWYELAFVFSEQSNLGLRPLDEGRALARDATNKALAIDSEYASAHAALSFFALAYDNDVPAAVRHIERALQLEPANTDTLHEAAEILITLGRSAEAIEITRYLLVRDPVNPRMHNALGYSYIYARQWDEAIPVIRTSLSLNPARNYAHYALGAVLMMKGQLEAALDAMQMENTTFKDIGLALVYHSLGRQQEADTALNKLITRYERVAPFNIAYIYAWRGDADRAFEWLDKAFEHRDSGLQKIAVHALLDNIHDDPRWLPFLERTGYSPDKLATIEFKVTLPE